MEEIQQHFKGIKQALSDEIEALRSTSKKVVLTHGTRMSTTETTTIYRFEVSDTLFFAPASNVRCAIGASVTFRFDAVVADVRSQFLFLLFPFDAGEKIPELQCEWNPEEEMERLNDQIALISPDSYATNFLARDFSNNEKKDEREPIFPSTFTQSQLQALKETMQRKISFVIGERKRGKSGVAAAFILSSIREGKKVLYLSSSASGLYDCMQEVIEFNPVVAEEQIAVFSHGIELYPPLETPVLRLEQLMYQEQQNEITTLLKEGFHDKVKNLFGVIYQEHEYQRLAEIEERLAQKQKEISEAENELKREQEELDKLQNASLMERMKMKIGKTELDAQQKRIRHKEDLVQRLKQHAENIEKEKSAKEKALIVPPEKRKEAEAFAAQRIPSLNLEYVTSAIQERPCLATTIHQAVRLDPKLLAQFDAVCIDDGQIFSVAEFIWMSSLAKDRCVVIADVTEQPPRSIAQTQATWTWLQKNYFTFYQQDDGDYYRFMVNLLPRTVASELIISEAQQSIFEACLTSALDNIPMEGEYTGKIYFLNTAAHQSVSPQYIGKRKILPFNEIHGEHVVACIKHALIREHAGMDDIMVVTPISGQSFYLREVLHSNGFGDIEIASLGSMRICSKKVVIFDTTVAGMDFTMRQLDDRKFGLIKLADTFNTLLSTVHDTLYVVTDLDHFQLRYKDRFIFQLLNSLVKVSTDVRDVASGHQRYDALPYTFRKRVISASSSEKADTSYQEELSKALKLAEQSLSTKEKDLSTEVAAAILTNLAKRNHINSIAQYFDAPPLYRSTPETIMLSQKLLDIRCEDEARLRESMDIWNLLIYETLNKQEGHPLSTKAKVETKHMQEIQQLHSFYKSELDMVVHEGKHKLAASIQKILNDVIGKTPVTPADWMSAYLVFLNRMERYLDTIINQIRL